MLPVDLAPAARFLVDVLWQSTAWLMLALLAARLLDRRPDRAHRVVLFGIAAALLTPIVTAVVRAAGLGALPAGGSGPIAARDLPLVLARALDVPQAVGLSWDVVVLVAWTLASAYLVARLGISTLAGRRLLRRADPLVGPEIERLAAHAAQRLRLNTAPVALASPDIACPMVWCWRPTPIVLIPTRREHAYDAPAARERMVAVLCHELAHWMRRDHIAMLLGEVAIAILPWHPLVWSARRRLHDLAEAACDEWVLVGGTPATTYAEALLDLAPTPRHSLALAAVTARRGLAWRVRRILGTTPCAPDRGPAWSLLLIVLTVALVGSFAAAQRRAPDAPDGVVRLRADAGAVNDLGVRVIDAGVFAVPSALDLGAVPDGEAASGVIHLVNTDRVARRIVGASTSCGCTTLGAFEPTDIAPGATIAVDVAISASGKSGDSKTKSVTFRVEDQAPVEVQVTVRVE